jgi:uncharacterized protein YdeI (BOF family)
MNMKMLPLVASSLLLTTCVLVTQAQTPASPAAAQPTKTAAQRAATYQGPKVVKDSKTLGRKMVQKSQPTDMRVPVPVKVK